MLLICFSFFIQQHMVISCMNSCSHHDLMIKSVWIYVITSRLLGHDLKSVDSQLLYTSIANKLTKITITIRLVLVYLQQLTFYDIAIKRSNFEYLMQVAEL